MREKLNESQRKKKKRGENVDFKFNVNIFNQNKFSLDMLFMFATQQ